MTSTIERRAGELQVGILGAGQLGRMLALAGHPIGVACRLFDPARSPSAAAVAETVRAAWDDRAALERFASGLDVVTYEFENAPKAAAAALAEIVPVRPSPSAVAVAQDRLAEKELFSALGIGCAPYRAASSEASLAEAVASVDCPCVVKTRRLGYDGKGQARVSRPEDVGRAWNELGGGDLIVEGFVPFVRELSVVAVRGVDGEMRFYPIVENVHRSGILHRSTAPARVSAKTEQTLHDTVRAIAERLGYAGVMAVELFDDGTTILANEIAPRVHNSGHWTIEGAVTSQFENHLRAVLGLPLGSAEARGVSRMLNLVGRVPPLESLLALPDAHIHLYGKSPKPGRKLGHITFVSHDDESADAAFAAGEQLVG